MSSKGVSSSPSSIPSSTSEVAVNPITTISADQKKLISNNKSLSVSLSGLLLSNNSKLLQLRDDASQYTERLKMLFRLTHPKHLFSTKAEIQRCQTTLQCAKDGNSVGVSPQDVSRCQSMLEACVHPTTREIVPFYGRMSSFAPANIPICAGMLFSSPTLANIIFWQWINQTYNAVFNHCNAAKAGNGSEDATNQKKSMLTPELKSIMKGYAGAVTVSVGLAVGLSQGLKRAKLSPTIKSWLYTIVPYTAVASAGMSNVGLMRMNELSTGLPVKTSEGVEIGHSIVAAKKALAETMISRAVLPIPTLLLPPPLIAIMLRWKPLQSSKFIKKAIEFCFITLGVVVGLPAAIALYPQDARLPLDAIEPKLKEKALEIRNRKTRDDGNKQGDLDDYVIFNKGL